MCDKKAWVNCCAEDPLDGVLYYNPFQIIQLIFIYALNILVPSIHNVHFPLQSNQTIQSNTKREMRMVVDEFQ